MVSTFNLIKLYIPIIPIIKQLKLAYYIQSDSIGMFTCFFQQCSYSKLDF